jgi:hypothetical protein
MIGVEREFDLFGATLWIAGFACKFLFVLGDVTLFLNFEITLGSILIACRAMLIISLIFDMEVNIIIYLALVRD